MPSPTNTSASEAPPLIAAEIFGAQIKLLYRQLPIALIGALLVTGCIVFILSGVVPTTTLTVWYVSFIVLTLLRTILYLRFQQTQERNYRRWAELHVIGSMASGFLIGSAAYLAIPTGIEYQSFVLFAIGGLAAGGLSTNGAYPKSFLALLLPMTVPPGIWFLIQGDNFHITGGALLLLFSLLVAKSSRNYANSLKEALRLQFTNEALNSNLEQEIAEREKQAQIIRENEAHMRAVFESAFDGILIFTPDGSIISCNPAAQHLFGFSAEGMLQKNILDLLPTYINAEMAEAHLLKLQGKRADGSYFPVAFAVATMALGSHALYVGVVHDETESQQIRDKLITARDAAQAANQAKSEFLSRMSHELRTPMNAILGFAQLLQTDQQTPLSTEHKESVEQISQAGWHLLNLINEVLDLSRVDTGHIEINPRGIEAGEILAECIRLISPMAENSKITLIDHASSTHALIVADYTRLKQVILNLLSNAIKYNQPGGSVTIEAPQVIGKHCRLAISDTGVGLSEEQTNQIFEPFTRVSKDTEQIEGTGIGLPITRKLLELMDGRIGVKSAPGKGSTFWFELPLAGEKVLTAHTENGENLPHTGPEGRQFKILHIEDDPTDLVLVKNILHRKHPGTQLISAQNGEQGLSLAQTEQPDLIILDLKLPGISGYEVINQLRRTPSGQHIPVVALSVNASPEDLQKSHEAGFFHHLGKPLDIEQFLAIIDLALQQPFKAPAPC
ncbi:ATP-binding protein [Pseudomonadota bacterium]